MRLPPGLSTNCFCGYRNRGISRAETGALQRRIGRDGINGCTGSPATLVLMWVPSLELFSVANGVVKGSFNNPFCY